MSTDPKIHSGASSPPPAADQKVPVTKWSPDEAGASATTGPTGPDAAAELAALDGTDPAGALSRATNRTAGFIKTVPFSQYYRSPTGLRLRPGIPETVALKLIGTLPMDRLLILVHPLDDYEAGIIGKKQTALQRELVETAYGMGVPSLLLWGKDYRGSHFDFVTSGWTYSLLGEFYPVPLISQADFVGGNVFACLTTAIRTCALKAFESGRDHFHARIIAEAAWGPGRGSFEDWLNAEEPEQTFGKMLFEFRDSLRIIPLSAQIILQYQGGERIISTGNAAHTLKIEIASAIPPVSKEPAKPKPFSAKPGEPGVPDWTAAQAAAGRAVPPPAKPAENPFKAEVHAFIKNLLTLVSLPDDTPLRDLWAAVQADPIAPLWKSLNILTTLGLHVPTTNKTTETVTWRPLAVEPLFRALRARVATQLLQFASLAGADIDPREKARLDEAIHLQNLLQGTDPGKIILQPATDLPKTFAFFQKYYSVLAHHKTALEPYGVLCLLKLLVYPDELRMAAYHHTWHAEHARGTGSRFPSASLPEDPVGLPEYEDAVRELGVLVRYFRKKGEISDEELSPLPMSNPKKAIPVRELTPALSREYGRLFDRRNFRKRVEAAIYNYRLDDRLLLMNEESVEARNKATFNFLYPAQAKGSAATAGMPAVTALKKEDPQPIKGLPQGRREHWLYHQGGVGFALNDKTDPLDLHGNLGRFYFAVRWEFRKPFWKKLTELMKKAAKAEMAFQAKISLNQWHVDAGDSAVLYFRSGFENRSADQVFFYKAVCDMMGSSPAIWFEDTYPILAARVFGPEEQEIRGLSFMQDAALEGTSANGIRAEAHATGIRNARLLRILDKSVSADVEKLLMANALNSQAHVDLEHPAFNQATPKRNIPGKDLFGFIRSHTDQADPAPSTPSRGRTGRFARPATQSRRKLAINGAVLQAAVMETMDAGDRPVAPTRPSSGRVIPPLWRNATRTVIKSATVRFGVI